MSLRFIDRAEKELEQNAIKSYFIDWAFESNITEETEKKKLDYQVRKCKYFITREKWHVQRWVKEWALGCMNSPHAAGGSQEAGFTQPRPHHFAQPCTSRFLTYRFI